MSQTHQSILETLRPELPPGLAGRIVAAVEREANRQVRFRARVATGCAFFSLVTFAISLFVVGRSFLASDFWQIVSLLSTDFSLVLSYSEDFLLSLVETFPAASALLLLAPLFLTAVSFAYRSRYLNLSMQRGPFQLSVSQ
ncbi:MAG: hypothetical protein WBO92_02080 [Candidatus Moraniibacteriota bacterium]